MRSTVATSVAVLILTAACGTSAPSPAGPTQPLTAASSSARDEEFVLTISTPQIRYVAGEQIHVVATLTYVGPLPSITAGSGSGLVGFAIDEPQGRRDQGPTSRGCVSYELVRDQPREVPFWKSGAYDLNEPDGPFWDQFFKDPVLRLPAGPWRITAVASFHAPGDCSGEEHSLRASVEITVVP